METYGFREREIPRTIAQLHGFREREGEREMHNGAMDPEPMTLSQEETGGTPPKELVKIEQQALESDLQNIPALSPRNEASEGDSVSDLSKAHEVSIEDETNANTLRDAIKKDGDLKAPPQILEELDRSISLDCNRSSSAEYSVSQPVESGKRSRFANKPVLKIPTSDFGFLQSLGGDPESIGLFPNLSNSDPDSLAALGTGGIFSEIIKTATDMIGNMEAEELQKMLEVAFSLNVQGPILNSIGSGPTSGFGFPEMTPEMIKMASDKVSKMTPEELQKLLEGAPLSNMNTIFSPRPTADCSTQRSKLSPEISGSSAFFSPNAGGGENFGSFPSSKIDWSSCSPPSSIDELQETMKHSMEDPDMEQMLTSMMNNFSLEMTTNTREGQGMEHEMEDVVKTQQARSSLSADDFNRMLEQCESRREGGEMAEKAPSSFMGRRTLILAFCMLILALVIREHRFISG